MRIIARSRWYSVMGRGIGWESVDGVWVIWDGMGLGRRNFLCMFGRKLYIEQPSNDIESD